MRHDPSYVYDRQDIDKLYQELYGRDSRDTGAEYWLNYANNTIPEGSVDRERLRRAVIAGAKPGSDDYNYYQSNVLNPPAPSAPPPITIPPPLPPPDGGTKAYIDENGNIQYGEPPIDRGNADPRPMGPNAETVEPSKPFNPADDTVPIGKGGAPTSGPGTVGYGKGGQDTAADLFRTGGARPMGPSTFSPYSSGDYYRNTMNRQADVFGRPSYMYSPQQSPYMPMQPYSMGSPYQDRMGKGGQGYNQRSPYSNPYGGSQGYDMMPPQTPYYQRPTMYNPMPQKGGPSGPAPNTPAYGGGTQAYTDQDGNAQYGPAPRPSYQPTPQKGGGTVGGASYQSQMGKGGQQPMMGQPQTGGNTPQPPMEPDPTDFSAQNGGKEIGTTQDVALQKKLAEIERLGGQSGYDQSRLNMARYKDYKGSDDYNAYTEAKGALLGDTANRRDAGTQQYVFQGNEYDTLGDPSTWDRATAINRDFYQSQGLVPMLTSQEYERLSNNLGRKPTNEELDYTRTQLSQDKNYMYDQRTGDSNQSYLDYINQRANQVEINDPFYQYNAQTANPYNDSAGDGRTTADYRDGVFDGSNDGVWNPKG